jgi:hypothetical protein
LHFSDDWFIILLKRMNKFRSIYLFALLIVVFGSILVSCGRQTSSSTSSGTSSDTTLFYTNVSGAAPVFLPVSASSSSIHAASSSWESGTALYSVFYSLREFLHSRDEGVVDRANLYKLLYDVDTVYSGLYSSAVSIESITITSPFSSFGSISCNRILNDDVNNRAIAMTETSTQIDAFINWIWTSSSTQKEYGLAHLIYNKVTRDISVDMVFSVDYNLANTATDYNLRCQVDGNAAANNFQFKYIIDSHKIVAKGISKGVGNYTLFKYVDASNPEKYIVVPAESGESYFVSQNSTPTNIYSSGEALPTTVASYESWVQSTNFFVSTDLLTDISTLNAGNGRAGTIFFNY